ncbi:hypothetical protein [Winogradskyella sp.]|uniref:hypothetical protein n=1 Tax=Winogradskyella sp. TaxID=1883156 RepID=UPI0025DB8110|nr:hypothetical protein [Winogradskyella sp.]
MVKSIKILVFLVALSSSIIAQNKGDKDEFRNDGYFNITRIGVTNVNKAELETFSPSEGVINRNITSNNSIAYSLQTINGFFFNPYFSIGFGIGLDGYHNPNYNTLPAFLDLRAYFSDGKGSPYVFINYGTLIKIENGTNNGNMANLGFGYKIPLNNKRFIIVADLSYSYKAISNDGLSIRRSESYTMLKGTFFSLGVIF